MRLGDEWEFSGSRAHRQRLLSLGTEARAPGGAVGVGAGRWVWFQASPRLFGLESASVSTVCFWGQSFSNLTFLSFQDPIGLSSCATQM